MYQMKFQIPKISKNDLRLTEAHRNYVYMSYISNYILLETKNALSFHNL